MNRGIVVEIKQGTAIVMTPEGEFKEIKRATNDCQLGEEIWFSSPRRRAWKSSVAVFSSMAAMIAFILVFVTFFTGLFGAKEIVAYVSIDINPSIEIGIDNAQKVRSLVGLNSDGERLVNGVSFSGKPLSEVTEALLTNAEGIVLNQGAMDIIVASTVIADTDALQDDKLSLTVKELIVEHMNENHPDIAENYTVAAFSTPKEVRIAAAEEGLSPGKFAIYLNAKSNGHPISINEIKQTSIHAVAEEAGGLRELIGSGPVTKELIDQLWQEEKSGGLDKKLQQIMNKNKKHPSEQTVAAENEKDQDSDEVQMMNGNEGKDGNAEGKGKGTYPEKDNGQEKVDKKTDKGKNMQEGQGKGKGREMKQPGARDMMEKDGEETAEKERLKEEGRQSEAGGKHGGKGVGAGNEGNNKSVEQDREPNQAREQQKNNGQGQQKGDEPEQDSERQKGNGYEKNGGGNGSENNKAPNDKKEDKSKRRDETNLAPPEVMPESTPSPTPDDPEQWKDKDHQSSDRGPAGAEHPSEENKTWPKQPSQHHTKEQDNNDQRNKKQNNDSQNNNRQDDKKQDHNKQDQEDNKQDYNKQDYNKQDYNKQNNNSQNGNKQDHNNKPDKHEGNEKSENKQGKPNSGEGHPKISLIV